MTPMAEGSDVPFVEREVNGLLREPDEMVDVRRDRTADGAAGIRREVFTPEGAPPQGRVHVAGLGTSRQLASTTAAAAQIDARRDQCRAAPGAGPDDRRAHDGCSLGALAASRYEAGVRFTNVTLSTTGW